MEKRDGILILPYLASYREAMLALWEGAVLKSHDFLSEADFQDIKAEVHGIDFTALQVFCVLKENEVLGFMGVLYEKVEMLFIHPKHFREGLGQALLNFAVKELQAKEVDVNEQNTKALRFYERFGFEVDGRSDKDSEGRAYPILHMRLRADKLDSSCF